MFTYKYQPDFLSACLELPPPPLVPVPLPTPPYKKRKKKKKDYVLTHPFLLLYKGNPAPHFSQH